MSIPYFDNGEGQDPEFQRETEAPKFSVHELAKKIVSSYLEILRMSNLGFFPEDVEPSVCLYLLTANYGQEFPVHYLHGIDLSQYNESPYVEEVSTFFNAHLYQLDPLDDSKCFTNISSEIHRILHLSPLKFESFKELYSLVNYRLFSSQAPHRCEGFIPKEIEDWISAISDSHPYKRVYAPHNLGASLIDKFSNSRLHISSKNERVSVTEKLHSIALSANQVSIDHRNFFYDPPADSQWASLIISTPPFNLKLRHHRLDEHNRHHNASSDALNIILTLEELSDAGKAIILTTPTFLFRTGGDEAVRVDLVDSNVIESVILLPPRLFPNTTIPVVILVLDKSRTVNQPIRFVDASNLTQGKVLNVENLLDAYHSNFVHKTSRTVDIEEVRYNNYNLTPKRYTMPLEAEYIPDDHKLIPLGEVLVTRQQRTTDNVGRIITPAQFGETGSSTSFIDIEESELPRRGIYRVDEECILLPRFHSKQIKVCHFVPDGVPIYVRDSVLVLRPLSKAIDLSWLTLTMMSPAFYTKLHRVSSSLRDDIRVTWRELSEISIVIPDQLEQQRQAVELARGALIQQKVKEAGLEAIIESTKREYLDNVRVKKHNLAQFVSSLKSRLSVLTKKLEKGEPIEPSSPIGRKETEASEYLSRLYKDCLQIGQLVKLLDDDQVVHPLETIAPLTVIKESFEQAGLDFIRIEYSFSVHSSDFDEDRLSDLVEVTKNPKIKIAKVDFEQIFMNVIDNIATHGVEGTQGEVNLMVSVNYYEATDRVSILFANDGKPLADGMNTRRFILNGDKAGKTGNTGIGGFHIHKVMQHVGGSVQLHDYHRIDTFDHLDDEDPALAFHHAYPNFTVGVELFFPNINS